MYLDICDIDISSASYCCENVLGTDVLMSILAVRKLYCSWTKSAPKVFVKKASENQ